MPIYEYACSACGHQLEVLQKINDAPMRKCPECGKSAMRRLVSAPSFRLKGGGWYETDFKAGEKRNLADGGKEEKAAAKDKPAKPEKDVKSAKNADKPAKAESKSKTV